MASQKESNISPANRPKTALCEALGMNTRWQRYNEQQKTLVMKLTKTYRHHHFQIMVPEQPHWDFRQTTNAMLQYFMDEQKKRTHATILSLEEKLAQKEDHIVECHKSMEIQKESNLSMADKLKIAEGKVEQLNHEKLSTKQLHEVNYTQWQHNKEQLEQELWDLKQANTKLQENINAFILQEQRWNRRGDYIVKLTEEKNKRDIQQREEDKETIKILKLQLEWCMEDVCQVRIDLKKANAEKSQLKKQLEKAKATISSLQEELKVSD